MADHINITHPDDNERGWRHMEQVTLLKAQLDIANKRIVTLESDLDSIFTRAQRGDEIWLCRGDAKIIVRPVASNTDDAAEGEAGR